MKIVITALLIAGTFAASARGQGFLNSDFESAYDLPGNPGVHGASVAVTNALPGWTANDGSLALSDIYFVSNSFPGVSSLVELEGGSLALSGDYSVGLFNGGSISQTGLVPYGAESLQFQASVDVLNLEVMLGGQSLSYSVLSVGPNYDVYGANIPAGMDGQVETLTFAIQGPSESLLDNIEFSTPEPSECVLIGIGAILFGARRRWKAVNRKEHKGLKGES